MTFKSDENISKSPSPPPTMEGFPLVGDDPELQAMHIILECLFRRFLDEREKDSPEYRDQRVQAAKRVVAWVEDRISSI